MTGRHDPLVPAVDPEDADVTQEVGGEGGSPGDVEIEIDSGAGEGNEGCGGVPHDCLPL